MTYPDYPSDLTQGPYTLLRLRSGAIGKYSYNLSQQMNLSPSEVVWIQPAAANASGTERNTTEDRWSALGFALPGLLTEVWGIQESRMDIHPAVDTGTRYDVICSSRGSEPESVTVERIQHVDCSSLSPPNHGP
jgi:hypothetical protein